MSVRAFSRQAVASPVLARKLGNDLELDTGLGPLSSRGVVGWGSTERKLLNLTIQVNGQGVPLLKNGFPCSRASSTLRISERERQRESERERERAGALQKERPSSKY